MTAFTDYWQRLGEQLGWKSSFRDPIPNGEDSDPRVRGYVDYLIVHHTATANEAVAADLMLPGGRTVSCNRLMGTDGKWRPNIPEHRRAYTSASWLDDIADTTEVVNTSGPDTYGMSDLQIMALAIWAVEKFRSGRLKAISRAYIVGHYEVLGISGAGYATSCPGPNTVEADRRLDLITEVAQALHAGLIGPDINEAIPPTKRGDKTVILLEDGGKNGDLLTGMIYWATDDGLYARVDLSKFPTGQNAVFVRPIMEKTWGPIVRHTSRDLLSVLSVYDSIRAAQTPPATAVVG